LPRAYKEVLPDGSKSNPINFFWHKSKALDTIRLEFYDIILEGIYLGLESKR